MKLLLIAVCVFFSWQSYCQPEYEWVAQIGDDQTDLIKTIRVDAQGNIFALHYNGGYHVVKMDASQNIIWTKPVPGLAHYASKGLAIDQEGNTYVSGYYSSAIYFDGFFLPDYGVSSYLLKLDPNGNSEWIRTMFPASTSYDYVRSRSVECDSQGNTIVSGDFRSPYAVFEADTLSGQGIHTQVGNTFVAKYDSQGNILWTENPGIMNTSVCEMDMTVDHADNILITTAMENDTLLFGSSLLVGSNQMVLLKYDSQGSPILGLKSSPQPGASGYAYGMAVACDEQNNIYVGGTFSGQVNLVSIASTGIDDPFIVKYDASGNYLWGNVIVGSGNDDCSAIAVDSEQNVYITGFFLGHNISIDGSTYQSPNNYSPSIYLAKYNANGLNVWSDVYGEYYEDRPASLAIDNDDNTYLAGFFESFSITFGNHLLYNVSNTNTSDAFVLKISADNQAMTHSLESDSFSLFPNPFIDRFHIKLDQSIAAGRLVITNLLGEVLIENSALSGDTFVVDRNKLPAGVYVLQLFEKSQRIINTPITVSD